MRLHQMAPGLQHHNAKDLKSERWLWIYTSSVVDDLKFTLQNESYVIKRILPQKKALKSSLRVQIGVVDMLSAGGQQWSGDESSHVRRIPRHESW